MQRFHEQLHYSNQHRLKYFKSNLKEIPFVLKVLSLLIILMIGSFSRQSKENNQTALQLKHNKVPVELIRSKKATPRPYFQEIKKN